MKSLSQDIFMMILVSALVFAALFLSACGKRNETPVCTEDPFAFEYHYASDPVGITHKTMKSTCSNSCTVFKALDQSGLVEQQCK